MRRFADFIVERRVLILVIVVCASIISAIASPFVPIVADESAYLQEDSEIRTGLDIIDEEFPETAHENTIRVMFSGLSTEQKSEVERQLFRVPYVTGVTYGDGTEYNKDQYTLYLLTTDYPYGSQQQSALEEGLQDIFEDYTITVENDSKGIAVLPWWLPLAALGVSLLCLFIFCKSWVEPLLICAVSVMAVCLNAGTNRIMGRISQMAASLTPTFIFLIALLLCVIVSYKWRRELRQTRNPYEAMKLTIMSTFPLLAAGAFATGAGFLMLIFLRSGLAADVGIVTAKGVVFAFLVVLLATPGMWLLTIDVQQRTSKWAPSFSNANIARTQYDYRRGFFFGFMALFAISCGLSFFTKPAFGITRRDPIANVFPEENHITIVYQNGDENPAGRLANMFQEYPEVSSVSSYATTLGRQYTPEAMFTMLHQTGSTMAFSLPILEILYYDYFTQDQLPFITAADLIRFINTDVDSAESIGDLLNDETKELFVRMGPFADQNLLKTPMGIAQAGQILGLDQEQTIALYSAYYAVRGGIEAEKMSPVTFLEYVINHIAPDPQFAEEMIPEVVEKLKALETYANSETAAAGINIQQAAQMEGFDEDTARIFFTEYFASQPSFTPDEMTLATFTEFLQTTVLENEFFSDTLPEGFETTLERVVKMSDLQTINRQMNVGELAEFFALNDSDIEDIVGIFHQTDTGLMSVQQFLSYLVRPDVFSSPSIADSLDEHEKRMMPRFNAAVQAAVNTNDLTQTEISQITALPIEIVESVFDALSSEEEPVEEMSIQAFLVAVTSDAYTTAINEEDMADLKQMQSVVNTAVQNGQFQASQMATICGITPAQASTVYTMYSRQQASGETMSPSELAHFVTTQQSAQATIEPQEVTAMRADVSIMDTAQTGNDLSSADAAALFDLSGPEAKLLYTFHDSFTSAGAAWTISLADLLEYVTSPEGEALDLIAEDRLETLKLDARIATAAADGEEFTAEEMAEILSLDVAFVDEVYIRYLVESGEVNTWTIPLYELIGFIADTTDTGYQGTGLEWVRQLKPLIDAVVNGKQYSALGFYMLLQSLGQNVDESTVELIYLYYATMHEISSLWTLSPLELVDFVASEVIEQPAYSAYLDDAMAAQIRELQRQIEASRDRLKGPHFSIMTVNTTLPLDSPEMRELFEKIREELDSTLVGTYYLTGNVPVSYEMANNFTEKWMLLTLLTDLCVFAGACFMMSSFLVPLVLTCLVQGGIWIVTGLMGIFGDVYYLALLVGQCFLAGVVSIYAYTAADDYREGRRIVEMEGSAKSFFTEGGAMATLGSCVTMVGSFATIWLLATATAPGQISRLLCFSLLCGELLVLVFLPGILTLLDGYIKAKPAPPIPIENKNRPGGGWSGKRLLDEDTLVGLSKGTFQKAEERPSSWASFVSQDTDSLESETASLDEQANSARPEDTQDKDTGND